MKSTIELLISMVLVGVVVFRFGKGLKANKKPIYLCATVLSVLTFGGMAYYRFRQAQIYMMYDGDPAAWESAEYLAHRAIFDAWYMMPYGMIAGGFLGVTIWSAVMWANYVKNPEWKKKLMSVRTELSILGTIISMAQAAFYAIYIPINLKTIMGLSPAVMVLYGVFILMMYYNLYLLIALGYTSFEKPKAKMGMAKWHKFHKKSYQFYAITFIEVMIFAALGIPNLFNPERMIRGVGAVIRLLIYLAIYIPYLVQRSKRKKAKKLKVAQA